jgi:hypothetical protein
VAKRPDVLVVESGEIELPGEVEMKNIGQPRNEVYACLAETIVLALEGRFENLTVGRQIEWEKVREIDRMGLKHGMKLAAISGVHGPFGDVDIARVRRRALAARARRAAKAKPGRSKPGTALAPKRRKAASPGKATAPAAKRGAKRVGSRRGARCRSARPERAKPRTRRGFGCHSHALCDGIRNPSRPCRHHGHDHHDRRPALPSSGPRPPSPRW